MICRFCGKEIPDDSLFCPDCGEKLESEASGSKRKRTQSDQSSGAVKVAGQALCPVCENVITDNNKLISCDDCGKKLCETCATHFKESEKEKSRKLVLCQECAESHKWGWSFDRENYALYTKSGKIYPIDRTIQEYVVMGLFEEDYEFVCPDCGRFDKNIDVGTVYGFLPSEKKEGATALYSYDFFACDNCNYTFLGDSEFEGYVRGKKTKQESTSYPIIDDQESVINNKVAGGNAFWVLGERNPSSISTSNQTLVLSTDFLCQFCLSGRGEYKLLKTFCSECGSSICDIHTEGHTLGGDKCPEHSDSGLCAFCHPDDYSIAEHECESCGKPICEEHVAREEGMIRKDRFCPDCA